MTQDQLETKITTHLKKEIQLKSDLALVNAQLAELNTRKMDIVSNLIACGIVIKELREILGDGNAIPEPASGCHVRVPGTKDNRGTRK